jgi:hypothetical protein
LGDHRRSPLLEDFAGSPLPEPLVAKRIGHATG